MQKPDMAKAIARIRTQAANPADTARMVIVVACAATLIAAGQILPF